MLKKTKPSIERYNPDFHTGLTLDQVDRRRAAKLVNVAKKKSGNSILHIFAKNIFTFFNMLLFGVAFMFIFIGGDVTTWGFLIAVILNIVIGIFQEIKAKIEVDKLDIINSPSIFVIRNGNKIKIQTKDIVLDDIVSLQIGDQIPVDGIVLDGMIEVNESMLTGESVPVKKEIQSKIMAGSFIVSGSCFAKADAIGNDTYISNLQNKAKKYKEIRSELYKSINNLIKGIAIAIIPLALANLAIGINNIVNNPISANGAQYPITWADFANFIPFKGWYSDVRTNTVIADDGSTKIVAVEPWNSINSAFTELFKSTGAMMTGMIPSGMILLTSVALAVGIMRLIKKKTMVKDLYSIETLARVDVLCLDKTGTITDGSMKVESVIEIGKDKSDIHRAYSVLPSYLASVKGNNQTMIAMIERFGMGSDFLSNLVVPFSSVRKVSAASMSNGKSYMLGAPEFVTNNPKILEISNKKATEGYRVLAFAEYDGKIDEKLSKKYPFKVRLLIVIKDNIRKEAIPTIKWFADNGVKIKIISGDNPITVSNIAKRVGLHDADKCISLEGMSLENTAAIADKFTIFGRVSPEQKAILVKSLKKSGHTVGMTGDGINDILAFREAQCSIAMAEGSDAAKSIANVVLLDSDFSNLPNVVGEGRRVVNNIEMTSTLFLMKTFFVMLFTIFSWCDHGRDYLLRPQNLWIVETFIIGVGGFFLALQPNDSKIEGTFMKTVMSKAIPAAFLLFVAGASGYLIGEYGMNPIYWEDLGTFNYELRNIISNEELNKKICQGLSTIMMTIAGYTVMERVCTPMNKYRRFLFYSMLICGALSIVLLSNIVIFPSIDKEIDYYVTHAKGNGMSEIMADFMYVFDRIFQYSKVTHAGTGELYLQNFYYLGKLWWQGWIAIIIFSGISIPLYIFLDRWIGRITARSIDNIEANKRKSLIKKGDTYEKTR